MKRRILMLIRVFVLLSLLSVPSSTLSFAQGQQQGSIGMDSAQRQVSYGGVSLSYNTALASNVVGQTIPRDEEGYFGGGVYGVWPEHTAFAFQGYPVTGDLELALIRVLPLQEYLSMVPDMAGDVEILRSGLAQHPADPGNVVTLIPPENAGPIYLGNFNYVNFQNGAGFRYVTQLAQDTIPISSNRLMYVYQGLSNDGEYLISGEFSISAPLDPEPGPDSSSEEIHDYNARMRARLSGLRAEQFRPSLGLLDEVFRSLSTLPSGDATSYVQASDAVPWSLDCTQSVCLPSVLTLSGLPPRWAEEVQHAADTWNNSSAGFAWFTKKNITDDMRTIRLLFGSTEVRLAPREVRVVLASTLDREYVDLHKEGVIGLPAWTVPIAQASDPTRMVAAYVVFNDTLARRWSTGAALVPDDLDAQTVALHELGHVLGLRHGSGEEKERPCNSHVMNSSVTESFFGKNERSLSKEDMTCLAVIYPSLFTTNKTFSETGKTVSGSFWNTWLGGRSYENSIYINGLPLTDERNEVSSTDGKTYKTQWFERARLEFHPENQPPFNVLFGLLGAVAAKGRENETPFRPVARPGASLSALKTDTSVLGMRTFNITSSTQSGLQWFPETRHTLGDTSEGGKAIAHYWTQLGGIPQFGFPLSQPFMERSKDDGKMYLVQYFERQRLEYHPENKGTRYEVLLGRLGAEQVRGGSGDAPTEPSQVGEYRTLSGHSDMVQSVSFSPDGQILASSSPDEVKLWRIADGVLQRTFETGADSVKFSPNGQVLAIGTRLVRPTDGSTVRSMATGSSYEVAFSPDGQFLAGYSGSEEVHLWRVSDGSVVRIFNGHEDQVRTVAFSPDGQLLASGGYDNTVRVWKVADGSLIRTLREHRSWVSSVAFAPDGQTLVSGALDGMVRLWRVADGALLHTFEGHTERVWSVAFAPNGKLLASGAGDLTVRLWNVTDGSVAGVLTGQKDNPKYIFPNNYTSVAFSPDGQLLAVGAPDGGLALWRVP